MIAEQYVIQRALNEFRKAEQDVTQERMRQFDQTIVQTSMEEIQESRRNLAAMVDRMNEMSSHFDARVEVAFTQINDRHTALADEVQARDAQLRDRSRTTRTSRS